MSADRTRDATGCPQRVILVTGPSGAGRTSAIRILEDLGYEAIDNLPLSMVPRLLSGLSPERPLALGVDIRNRDFRTETLTRLLDELDRNSAIRSEVLYLDCRQEVLLRRFSETRRPHPLMSEMPPDLAVAREVEILQPIRDRADVLLDTSGLSPHELHAALSDRYALTDGMQLSISLHSFSYKSGTPQGLDMMFDCRFLANPHWVPELRAHDGRNPAVARHVASDPRYDEFRRRVHGLIEFVLPQHRGEGRTHVAIGFGCTGGRHRSVALAENLCETLAQAGWQVSIRHREIERQAHRSV